MVGVRQSILNAMNTNPTPDEINELLATKAGWKKVKQLFSTDSESKSQWQFKNEPLTWDGIWDNYPPDYYHDLNAVAELENAVLDEDIHNPDSPRYAYSRMVYKMCVPDLQPFRAPAHIRAEALARLFFPERFDNES